MIVNLHGKNDMTDVDVGDILVFCNGVYYDYYLVAKSHIDLHKPFKLVSLCHSSIEDRWVSLNSMLKDLKNNAKNDYVLTEVIGKDDVVISRVSND